MSIAPSEDTKREYTRKQIEAKRLQATLAAVTAARDALRDNEDSELFAWVARQLAK